LAVPVEANEIAEFTPASLINVPDAPVFRLRAPDERNMRRYNMLVQDDNLRMYSTDEFTSEKEVAIKALWSAEDAQSILGRFRNMIECEKQNIDLSDEDIDWRYGKEGLEERLLENHRPLAVMKRKTNEYFEYSPRYAIGTILKGWKNLDMPFRLEAGYMKTADVATLAKHLIAIEEKAIADKVEGVGLTGTAFLELWIACVDRTRLTGDEEKNLPAPSLPTLNPEGSTAEVNGASIAESGKDESISLSSASTPTKKSAAKDASLETQGTA
jgi:hypothetical protein